MEEQEQVDAILQRLESTDQGTFGRFSAGGLVLYSGELPWLDNARDVSCVPPGTYRAGFTYSPRFGRLLYLLGLVPNRTGVRIHSANLMGNASKGFKSQLNGCIALGERLGSMDGQKALLLSAPAVRRLQQHFSGRPFVLEIKGLGDH